VTVLETIQRSADFLSKKGVESPRLQAELLLAYVLKLPRMRLYLSFDRTLIPGELDPLRDLVLRRSRREPLQQIIGSTSFCGLEIAVNRDVLVPRPETELLAESGWEFLNQIAASSERGPESQGSGLSAMDYGTGSGCLALALASKCPLAKVHALDVSPAALETAKANAQHLGLTHRLCFWLGDGFQALPELRFDLLISNPPYIPTAEIATLEPEVRDFDPRQALDGGADGLDHYRRLASGGGAFLNPAGKLMIEFGDGQSEPIRALLEAQNWVVERIGEDYTQRPRIMIAHRRAEPRAQMNGNRPAAGGL